MSEQRFTIQKASGVYLHLPIFDNSVEMADGDVCILLNEQQATIERLEEEKDYWKSKAMTLLMQVRRLTPRMTDKEVKEFNKELEE